MATESRSGETSYDGRLFEWYTKYVTEPESKKDVYGYTLLVLGYVLAMGGLVVYQIGSPILRATGLGGDARAVRFLVTEIAGVPAAVGLVAALLGIVLLLPVTRASLVAAVVGSLASLAAVVLFVMYYPGNWWEGTPSYAAEIIGLYTVGVAVSAGVVIMVPVITGERSYFSETATGPEQDHPAVMIGEADRGGLFAVFKRGTEWTWRFIDQSALAGSTSSFLSRIEAEDRVESVKSQVAEAGLLEIKNAAFRLYESAGGSWQWYLMRDDGTAVAEGGSTFASRDAADASINAIKDHGTDAEVLVMDDPVYDTHRDGGVWRWRLLDRDRTPLALGADGRADRADATRDLERFRDLAGVASELVIEDYGVELLEADDGWAWHLRDETHRQLAESVRTVGSKSEAEDVVYDLLDRLQRASVLEAGTPTFDVYQSGSEWRWRLVDESGRAVARAAEAHQEPDAARGDAETVQTGAPDADVVEIEDLEFETYRTADGWQWRLVNESREVHAESTEPYESEEAASRIVDRVKTEAPEADLIEFENAAFQVYEAPGGAWRWRLVDEDGTVLADSGQGEYESKDGAMSAMTTLQENAPDAEHLEIENAAFELFEDERGWGWRLVDDIGETIADGATRHDTEAGAREAMDRLVASVSDVTERLMDAPIFQVYPADEEWRWRFLRPDGRTIAESTDSFGTRHEVEDAVADVAALAEGAPVETVGRLAVLLEPADASWSLVDADREPVARGLVSHDDREAAVDAIESIQRQATETTVYEIREAAFDCYRDDEGWTWRLVDEDHEVVARAPETVADLAAVEDAVETVSGVAPDAEFVDYDDLAFELYREDDRWTWQLLDEAGSVLAVAATGYESREEAAADVEAARDEIAGASVIEIDSAAFEFHHTDAGWRWRLVDEHGDELGQSVHAFESRAEAQAELSTVKELGPEAWVSVAE
jgi:uncharacterized protein YegP (UPF0339 family)